MAERDGGDTPSTEEGVLAPLPPPEEDSVFPDSTWVLNPCCPPLGTDTIGVGFSVDSLLTVSSGGTAVFDLLAPWSYTYHVTQNNILKLVSPGCSCDAGVGCKSVRFTISIEMHIGILYCAQSQ